MVLKELYDVGRRVIESLPYVVPAAIIATSTLTRCGSVEDETTQQKVQPGYYAPGGFIPAEESLVVWASKESALAEKIKSANTYSDSFNCINAADNAKGDCNLALRLKPADGKYRIDTIRTKKMRDRMQEILDKASNTRAFRDYIQSIIQRKL